MQAGDFDADGDLDVVVGRMHTTPTPTIRVLFNGIGQGTQWAAQVVDSVEGIHNGVVADIDADGDVEIIGSNWTGNPPLRVWTNRTPQPRMRIADVVLTSPGSDTVHVSNAPSGAPVILCATLAGLTTPCPVSSLGTTFELAAPTFVGVVNARPNGVATFPLPLPPGLRGLRVWFQALGVSQNSIVAVTTVG